MVGGGVKDFAVLSYFAFGALRHVFFAVCLASAYFFLVDIDLDMPHAVPDDNDDDEGDDPFDELHDLGNGDEEDVNNHIATLEQAIAAVAPLQSTVDVAEPLPDIVVLAVDVVVPAAHVAVPVDMLFLL